MIRPVFDKKTIQRKQINVNTHSGNSNVTKLLHRREWAPPDDSYGGQENGLSQSIWSLITETKTMRREKKERKKMEPPRLLGSALANDSDTIKKFIMK